VKLLARIRAALSWLFSGFYARELTGEERDSVIALFEPTSK